jgi:tetratricopeptide (TPR) repeat protein
MRIFIVILMIMAIFTPAYAQTTDNKRTNTKGGLLPVTRATQDGTITEPDSAVERLIDHIKKRNASLELQAKAVEAFNAGDLTEAERLFTEQAALDPGNFTAHYNLACMRAIAGDKDAAWAHLTDALQNGFIDAYQLQRDDSFASMQGDKRVRALIANFPLMIEAHREASVKAAGRWLGSRAEHRTIELLRLEVFSNHDKIATDDAAAELEQVAAFAATFIPDLTDAQASRLDPWVVVTLPDQGRFMNWTIQTFGPAARGNFSAIGGAYDHDARRLVARDLGATLRHEFFHVLLWRDMTRRDINMPIWIQEGLASLVEDGNAGGGGGGQFVPVPSWRTNIAKRLEKNHRLPPIEKLTTLTHERFSMNRPLRQYALARTFFLYLYDRGVLAKWYRLYTDNAETDPNGLTALETVLGMNADDMHKDYRQWLRNLPMIAETAEDLKVRLGIDIDNGSGDGPRVIGFVDRDAKRTTGLKLRDVITAINSQPTRDLQELIRILDGHSPGQTVTLDYRRGKLHGQTTVTLRKR